MTYYITAHTDEKSLLIVSESRTDDHEVATFIAELYEAQGHHVTRREEG